MKLKLPLLGLLLVLSSCTSASSSLDDISTITSESGTTTSVVS
ncbi:MAG TPA: hypothetical protein VFD05_01480 [Bacilli bacterium]|nr:hypothetical protein [Bacilli bacterium]